MVQFTYTGRVRVAEPHDYGMRGGVERLLVYQTHGGRPSVPGWRLLDVNKIGDLLVLDRTFKGSRGTSYHNHYQWDDLFARVD